MKNKSFSFLTLSLALMTPLYCAADTVIIGKGTGVLWEGLPFNVTLSGSMTHSSFGLQYGLMNIGNSNTKCMSSGDLTTIAGYQALKIAPGVGLIPRATGQATYTAYDGSIKSFTGTIGLPETRGGDSGELTSPTGYGWCLPPSMTSGNNFYAPNGNRVVNISGTWALVADGTQTSSTVAIPTMYASSFSVLRTGDRYQSILPASINLRISTLACSVNTPTVINFGTVGRNLTANTELSKQTNSFNVTCTQNSGFISANVAVQFRPLTSLYEGSSNRLALAQGGGYITGEIPGLTDSGICEGNSGINFNNEAINIGKITASQSLQTFSNQIIWRLCSGGNTLPTGSVSASTEMLVTFN